MMARLTPYLTFGGNCAEAMQFYKDCLGGELVLNAVGDSPIAAQLPPHMANQILHSALTTNELEIMATDMQPEPISEGNAVHLCLICNTTEETKKLFDLLSAGGKVNQPLHEMFFGLIGALTDKFGKRWILECNKD
jgi:PhnB protein